MHANGKSLQFSTTCLPFSFLKYTVFCFKHHKQKKNHLGSIRPVRLLWVCFLVVLFIIYDLSHYKPAAVYTKYVGK